MVRKRTEQPGDPFNIQKIMNYHQTNHLLFYKYPLNLPCILHWNELISVEYAFISLFVTEQQFK